ncbi:MAG: ATP-binding protein [Desulfovibrionaceae bacterium]|nr:ATP-binding protein [Desulfovibrionaceae bacterium]
MKEYECPALPENLRPILALAAEELSACGTIRDVRERLFVILEELFNNVAFHAYEGMEIGPVRIQMAADQDSVLLCIEDRGVPFNPLNNESLEKNRLSNLESFEEGGAGIFLVKTLATNISYVRQNGWNQLKIFIETRN